MAEEQLLLPEQAASLLRTQLEEEVELLRHDDPDVYGWELLTLNIVKRAFGQRSQHANQFATTLSYAGQSQEKAQAWHVENIKSKKGILRAFIRELEILSPHEPRADDARFAKMAVEEARKSIAEDERTHPMVGCVVVKDGKVLATSHRGEIKACHAEFIALEKKLGGSALTGCTVYTTLEPCTARNHPKIPCADRLIERRVARVVIGTLDPNPDIRGKGYWKIQDANIPVDMFPHALAMELKELNRHFFRPFFEPATAGGQTPKESQRIQIEKRKLYNLLRKINCIECDFHFPPGPQDAVFNGQCILLINKDIENIRDGLVELLDLPEAGAVVDARIPGAPLGNVPWSWLEATWKEHFLPVQNLFRKLKAEVLAPKLSVGGTPETTGVGKPSVVLEATKALPDVSLARAQDGLQHNKFVAADPGHGSARFRASGQALGLFWNIMPFAEGPDYEVFLADGPTMWLRLMPREDPSKEWGHDELMKCGRGPAVSLQPLLWNNLQYLRAEDGVGAYATSNSLKQETQTTSVAFAFNSGEIWCVDTKLLQLGEQSNLYFTEIARALIHKLRGYGEFLQCLGVQPPFDWIAGLEGVKGRRLKVPPPINHIATSPGETCLSDVVVASGSYDIQQSATITLRPFFAQLFKKCSSKIPDHIEDAIRTNEKF